MTRIKERNRRKAALNDRKSAASQARMKSIANLAADDRVPKKRRKAGGGTFTLQSAQRRRFTYTFARGHVRCGRRRLGYLPKDRMCRDLWYLSALTGPRVLEQRRRIIGRGGRLRDPPVSRAKTPRVRPHIHRGAHARVAHLAAVRAHVRVPPAIRRRRRQGSVLVSTVVVSV